MVYISDAHFKTVNGLRLNLTGTFEEWYSFKFCLVTPRVSKYLHVQLKLIWVRVSREFAVRRHWGNLTSSWHTQRMLDKLLLWWWFYLLGFFVETQVRHCESVGVWVLWQAEYKALFSSDLPRPCRAVAGSFQRSRPPFDMLGDMFSCSRYMMWHPQTHQRKELGHLFFYPPEAEWMIVKKSIVLVISITLSL